MRIRSAACWLTIAIVFAIAGCKTTPQVTYLRETEKAVHLKQGDAAPHDGWLLSDGGLAGLYDAVEGKLNDAGHASP
jgi:hypothetical protein